jgi:abortive infection bacteriophage resistance protein
MSLYSNSNKKSGREILSRIYYDISKRSNDYLRHYENKHSYLPTWIMIKALTFGTLIKLIINTDDKYKKELCDLYEITYKNNDFRKLTAMLSLINALRNNIAHSERIIDFKGNPNNKRSFTKYHKLLNYNSIKQERLIDVLLYMKMFIPGKEYKVLINEIINEFRNLKTHIHNNAFIKICSTIGLNSRMNYKDALEEIKSNSHVINYSALI